MKKLLLLPSFILGAAFAGSLVAAEEAPKSSAVAQAATSTPAGWTDDFEAAKKRAAAEGKILLVDFSGSDWCGWCVRLDKEVFSKKEFLDGAKDKYVLVFIDSPNNPQKLSALAKKQNPGLVKAYGIEGYPSVLLMDAEGNKLTQTGYHRGGPVKYLEHLDELLASVKPILELNEKIKDMKPGSEERVKAIHAVMKTSSVRTQKQNRKLIWEVLAFDKDGSAGMRDSYPLFTILMPLDNECRELFGRINADLRNEFVALKEDRRNKEAEHTIREKVLKSYESAFADILKKIEAAEKEVPEGEVRDNLGKMRAGITRLYRSVSGAKE